MSQDRAKRIPGYGSKYTSIKLDDDTLIIGEIKNWQPKQGYMVIEERDTNRRVHIPFWRVISASTYMGLYSDGNTYKRDEIIRARVEGWDGRADDTWCVGSPYRDDRRGFMAHEDCGSSSNWQSSGLPSHGLRVRISSSAPYNQIIQLPESQENGLSKLG